MNVNGWLKTRGTTTPSLFPAKRHGQTKRAVGQLLAVANAGASGVPLAAVREDFYRMKRAILEKYGEPVGTDWQVIERECWGCGACDEDGFHYGRGEKCNGDGVYSRTWIPLARWRLGRSVFHLPGERQFTKPDRPVTIRGRIAHREVDDFQARRAFATLALWFDPELFRRTAANLFAIHAVTVGW